MGCYIDYWARYASAISGGGFGQGNAKGISNLYDPDLDRISNFIRENYLLKKEGGLSEVCRIGSVDIILNKKPPKIRLAADAVEDLLYISFEISEKLANNSLNHLSLPFDFAQVVFEIG